MRQILLKLSLFDLRYRRLLRLNPRRQVQYRRNPFLSSDSRPSSFRFSVKNSQRQKTLEFTTANKLSYNLLPSRAPASLSVHMNDAPAARRDLKPALVFLSGELIAVPI